MKRIVSGFALMALLVSVAFAGTLDFGIFSIDVADGWTATPDGNTVGIVRADSTASMSITVEENDGSSVQELAEAFMRELNGKNLTTDEHGNAVFEFDNSNGVTSRVVLNADADHFGLIVITIGDGTPSEARTEIGVMLDTLKFRDI